MTAIKPALRGMLLAAVFCCNASAQDPAALEYEVKAAYLYNFAKFVTWPESAGNRPLQICVMGKDPFGAVLDSTVQGKSVHGQAIAIRRLQISEQPQGCQIVFLVCSGSSWKDAVSHDNWEGILLVGDGDAFARKGGMIGLLVKDGRVQFEINLDALNRAHLEASSKLLQLATVVKHP